MSEVKPILSVRGLVKRFGGLLATDHIDFDLLPGEVHAVIGPNGAGKTTFLSQLAGELRPDEGSIVFGDVDITHKPVPERAQAGVGRSYQISQVFRDMTALENVLLAVQATEASSFSFLSSVFDDEKLLEAARHHLRLCGLGARENTVVSILAHGEHRQLELAMTLATRPTVLLLDEPMAGMSQAESVDMIRLLKEIKKHYAIVLVEHDMDAVFSLADRISVLVYGRVLVTGTPEEIRENELVKEAYLGDQEEV
ncbi:ABC transporter ATP-binding protein [Pusillimonas caeni]|uniref:ABC transporter ATP-binding protein n=1 Tax=Pusillimonas caeni TaxID=1348472 RepID=UPI000E59E058|nr:ABC transporter ATP-binding protein [Pusillimonas caeni]TFL08783.1 ABC transporter ATP-binding protein [Pusillimonas caeni]